MAETFLIQTEREGVRLERLTFDDAPYYFEAVDANREHLSQFGDNTAEKYPDIASVERSIQHPENPLKKRYGIWDGEQFVGSINLTPEEGQAEIGYWVDGLCMATISLSNAISCVESPWSCSALKQ